MLIKYIHAVSEMCACFPETPIRAKSCLGFSVQVHLIYGHFSFIRGHGHDGHDEIQALYSVIYIC